MENLIHKYVGETEREEQKDLLQNNERSCTSNVLIEQFYTSPYGLTEVLTRTSMLITKPLH